MKTKEERSEERRKCLEQEARGIEAAKAEMAEECGLERCAKFDRAWEIAWGYGHSNGISEVKNYFREISELLKP